MEKANELLKAALEAALDKKAGDIEVISVKGMTTLSDYFIICTGTSTTHVKSVSDGIEKALKEKHEVFPHHVEGYHSGNWVLLDYGHILIHIFLSETRRFYSLERLWDDAPKLDISEILGKKVETD